MRYWALQSYTFADSIVKFYFGIFRESIPMCLFQAPKTNLEIIVKIFHPLALQTQLQLCEYSVRKTAPCLKAACYRRFRYLSVYKCTSILQLNTDALYMVTLNLYETKVP